MPRVLRILLTGLSFALFFGGSLGIGLLLFPPLLLLALGNRERQRRWASGLLQRGYGTFLFWMRLAGLIRWQSTFALPAELRGKGYVLIANHPTLIDVLYFLHWCPGLTCVVKSSWYRNAFFGPLLRATHYVPGPAKGELGDDAFERMVEHVQRGHALLLFPEGTRSSATELHRFRKGAFEIASRCNVPIVEAFVAVDRPMLMKGVPFWHVPDSVATWRFESMGTVRVEDATAACRDSQERYRKKFAQWVSERDAAE